MKFKKCILVCVVLIFSIFSYMSFASSNELNLYVSQSVKLTSKLFDGNVEIESNDINWKSDNSSIASVDSSGNVRANNSGSTYIRAIINTGTHIQEATIKVNVESTLVGVNINTSKDKKIYVGEEFVIEYEVEKKKDLPIIADASVRFVSTNPEVASVDSNGRVVGLKEGSVNILIITNDGSKRDYINLKVSGLLTKVDIVKKEETVYVGEEFTLDVDIEPKNVILKDLEWSTFDSTVLEVVDKNKGIFKGKKSGDAYIKVVSKDGEKVDTTHIIVKSLVSGIKTNIKKIVLDDEQKTAVLQYKLIKKYDDIEILEKGVNFKNSDSSIVSVDSNGNVTALKKGLVRIDITTVDGGYMDYVIVESNVSTPKEEVVYKKYPMSIKFLDVKKNVLVGEKVPLNYEIFPEDITEKDVSIRVINSLGYSILKENGVFYFISKREGVSKVRIETVNNKVDEVLIFSKSTIKDASIITDLEKKYGSYIVYLGMEGTLRANLVPNSNSDRVILDTVTWKSSDSNIIEINSNGEFKVKDYGTARITMITDDGNITDEINIRVENMVEEIKLDNKVTIGLKSPYMPNATFKLKKDLLYGYEEVIDKTLNLSIEDIYITREFLNVEKKYEAEKISELENSIKLRSSNISELLKEKQKHKKRLINIEYFLDKTSSDYVKVNYGGITLTDREFNDLKIAEIKNNELYFYVVGYVKLKVTSRDSNKYATMEVYSDENVKSLLVYDELGNLISSSDKDLIDELKKSSEELKKKLEEEKRLEEERKLNEKKEEILSLYSGRNEKDIPSDWALLSVNEFSEMIDYKDILFDFRKNITREEFAKLAVKVYESIEGKKLKKVYSNYFLDTEDEYVLLAYQLGIVNGTSFRKFSPNDNITRQQMAVMLDKMIEATAKELDKEKLKGKVDKFSDEDQIKSWAKNSMFKLSKQFGVFSGTSNDRLDPEGYATREQAISLVVKILNGIK